MEADRYGPGPEIRSLRLTASLSLTPKPQEMRHWNPEAHIGDDGYVLADVKAAVAEATAGTTDEQEMRRVERIYRQRRGANARRPAQRGANARRPAQRGAARVGRHSGAPTGSDGDGSQNGAAAGAFGCRWWESQGLIFTWRSDSEDDNDVESIEERDAPTIAAPNREVTPPPHAGARAAANGTWPHAPAPDTSKSTSASRSSCSTSSTSSSN
eukprot:jgi/Tetstr1/436374/TSEL_025207.t1